MAQKHHVFLSYSRHDAEIMRQVRATLQAEGLTVWSMEGIEPGTPLWDRAVEDALKAAGCMVVILTPHVIESKGVRDEIHYAQIHKVRIFPLLAAGDQETSIPYTISGVQFTDIRSRYDLGMGRLVGAVSRVMGLDVAETSPHVANPQSYPVAPPNEPVPPHNPFTASVSRPQPISPSSQPTDLVSQRPAWLRNLNLILMLKFMGALTLLTLIGFILGFVAYQAGLWSSACNSPVYTYCDLRWREVALTLGLAVVFSFIVRRIAGWWRRRQWRVLWLYMVLPLSSGFLLFQQAPSGRYIDSGFIYSDVGFGVGVVILAIVLMLFLPMMPFGWLLRLFGRRE